MVDALILTVTRACNLRCSYCPTAKDGWPSLTAEQATDAIDLFASRWGGGDIKLFGGEPLLVPEVVRAAIDHAIGLSAIRRVYLSTNGLGLDDAWLDYVSARPKLILTLSLDGRPEDHRRLRRSLGGVPDSYAHVVELLPRLRELPRLVITQTIAPATAAHAAENFEHLLELGFRRFNFLPGYYIPWRPEQLEQLQAGFDAIAERVRSAWAAGERLYVRNLFVRAPTAFFNSGVIVDSDATIHASNLGLSAALEELRGRTQVGTLAEPPSREALAERSQQINGLLAAELPEQVWQSTLAADAALTRFCTGLWPDYVAQRRRRGQRGRQTVEAA